MIAEWDGKSPVEAARQIIADCKNNRGELDERSLRSEITSIVLELYKAQGRTVTYIDINADATQMIAQLDDIIAHLPRLNESRRRLGFISAKLHQVRQMFILLLKNKT